MSAHLTLVGVVHRDPEGGEKLLRLLESRRPDAMTVELSPLGLLWREARSREMLQRLDELVNRLPPNGRGHHQLQLIREALRIPFEFSASRRYAGRHGVPLHLVDLNWVSREHLPWYESEIITSHNLKALLEEPERSLAALMNSEYRRAAACLARGLSREDKESATWEEAKGRRRERFLACRVRSVAERHRRVTHIGGWVHLVYDSEGHSLASLLRDLVPQRRLLAECDEGNRPVQPSLPDSGTVRPPIPS